METTTTFDLRAAIVAAAEEAERQYAEQTRAMQAREQAEAAQKAAQDTAFLTRTLHKVGIPVDATAPEITIDGLTFVAQWYYQSETLWLVQPCPNACGGTVERGPIYRLSDVAGLLATPPREACKACEQAAWDADHAAQRQAEQEATATYQAERAAEVQSLEARLLTVLREFIRAETGGEG